MLKREDAIENIKEVIEYLELYKDVAYYINYTEIEKLKKVLKFLES